MEISNPEVARSLAARLDESCPHISMRVSERLLREYPELIDTLRMTTPSAAARLSDVAVGRLCQLMRAVLLFRQPVLADKEFEWSVGVLPRYGVHFEHQNAMVRWFFEEVRALELTPPEHELADELEQHLLAVVASAHASVKGTRVVSL